MRHSCSLAVGVILLLCGGRAQALDITSCGQTVPAGETGVLVGDLQCDPATRGVTLQYAATLDLNGHALVAPDGWAVWCNGRTRL